MRGGSLTVGSEKTDEEIVSLGGGVGSRKMFLSRELLVRILTGPEEEGTKKSRRVKGGQKFGGSIGGWGVQCGGNLSEERAKKRG